MKKIFFFTIWLGILALSFLTLIKDTPIAFAITTPARLTNFIQRGLGLFAFSLLFIQIILGAFMGKISKRLGSWVFYFHALEGIFAYILVFLHPIFFLLSNHYAGGKFDLYAAFVNVCLLCKPKIEYYYTIGRVSFWLLTTSVLAAIFRKSTPWLKANWRKFHVLNYVTFLAIGVHGFYSGTDFRIQPFYSFGILAFAAVLGIVIFVELPRFYKNFKEWLKD